MHNRTKYEVKTPYVNGKSMTTDNRNRTRFLELLSPIWKYKLVWDAAEEKFLDLGVQAMWLGYLIAIRDQALRSRQ